jgi:transposase-like protein
MNKLPKFAGNLKYWRILNKLVFGDAVGCPDCSRSLAENYRRKYLWCKWCRKKYRATTYKGSWLYGMKLSPRQLFILLWCWQHRKSPDTARLMALVSYTAVQRWYLRFRTELPKSDEVKLAELVAADESFFGRLRSRQDQEIVAGVISHLNRLRLITAGQRDAETLSRFICETVEKGALVLTDEWRGYNDLEFYGYGRESWNHARGRLAGTNQIERVWSAMKRHLRKLYGCIPTRYLHLILKEWEARHNFPQLFTNPETYLAACLFHVS